VSPVRQASPTLHCYRCTTLTCPGCIRIPKSNPLLLEPKGKDRPLAGARIQPSDANLIVVFFHLSELKQREYLCIFVGGRIWIDQLKTNVLYVWEPIPRDVRRVEFDPLLASWRFELVAKNSADHLFHDGVGKFDVPVDLRESDRWKTHQEQG